MAISSERIEAQSEVLKSLIPTVVKDSLHLFLPPDDPRKWQPSDFFPDVSRDGVTAWQDGCAMIREQAQTLSRPLRVVVAGNGITEAGLSLFSALLARLPGMPDSTGIDDNPLAIARRWWVGDENRHHEGTYTYASLSGIYNMAAIDRTIHVFHRNGVDTGAGLDIYKNLFFVVKQEGDTMTAHQRSGLLSRDQQYEAGIGGKPVLYYLLMAIAGEEGSHHVFYRNIFGAVIEKDPEGAIIAIRDMQKVGTIMPGKYMGDINGVNSTRSSTLFEKYAKAGNRLNILTLMDDVRLDEELFRRWRIADLKVSGESAVAQEQIFRRHAIRINYAHQLEEKKAQQNAEEGDPDVSDFAWLIP